MFRVIVIFLFISSSAMANDMLVPESFIVPVEKEMPEYVFLKVDPKYSELDYKALMSSRSFIRKKLDTTWPSDTFTLEENTETLIIDLKAFELKTNFTYHILDKSRSEIIGCFYISSTTNSNYDAAIFVWVAKKHLSSNLFKIVKLDIKDWLSSGWPFKKIDFSLNKT